jgi:hypothetical protein
MSGIVAVVVHLLSRERRGLTCVVDPMVSPVEAGEGLGGEIGIRAEEQPGGGPFLARAMLRCTGNVPIRKEHVVEPVTFTFDPETRILKEPTTAGGGDRGLEAAWKMEKPNVASLTFKVLHPGDVLLVEFMCQGTRAAPTVTARIEGVASMTRGTPQGPETPRVPVIALLLAWVLACVAVPLAILIPDLSGRICVGAWIAVPCLLLIGLWATLRRGARFRRLRG